ncbi:MAG: murein L,D-transpeptidase family protein [Luteolibacter sp.]
MKPFSLLLALALLPSCGDKAKGQAREKEVKARIGKDLTEALEEKDLALGSPVFIRAFKEERILELFVKDQKTGKYGLFRSYPIVAASGELGPKLAEGDGQVPEGFYYVPPAAMLPTSRYHLAFNIGYPNDYDKAHGRTGSFIMIHGSSVSIGCLAMTDAKIEEIYTICDAAHDRGQGYFRVHIFPFRMTEERMQQAADDASLPFWENLKTGYDLFEKNKVPPDVSVKNKRYVFK